VRHRDEQVVVRIDLHESGTIAAPLIDRNEATSCPADRSSASLPGDVTEVQIAEAVVTHRAEQAGECGLSMPSGARTL